MPFSQLTFFNFCPFLFVLTYSRISSQFHGENKKSFSFSKARCEKWSLADKLRICWLLLQPAEIIEALWDSAFITLINFKSSMHQPTNLLNFGTYARKKKRCLWTISWLNKFSDPLFFFFTKLYNIQSKINQTYNRFYYD